MPADLVLTPEAEQDLTDAGDTYERQRPGRGAKFLDRAADGITAIRRSPKAFSPCLGRYRRMVVRHFPYVIVYHHDEASDTVTIYAVFHTSQDPKKLLDRLS